MFSNCKNDSSISTIQPNMEVFNTSIAIEILIIPEPKERGQKVSVVLKRAAGVFPWL